MQAVAAFSSMALTLGLVLTRPRITENVRVGPGIAALVGAVIVLLTGAVSLTEASDVLVDLWRALLTIAAIMLMTASALRLGVLDRVVATVLPHAGRSTTRLFVLVFSTAALTAAVLNNDAAILLLTPLVVLLVRRVFGSDTKLVVPFAFAVFMAAGVAPLVVSNPMNMIVADFAGIGFNEYAIRMIPISIAGSLVTLGILLLLFRPELRQHEISAQDVERPRWGFAERAGMTLLLGVLLGYPIVSYLGGPIWLVATTGAVLMTALTFRETRESPLRLIGSGIAWETLIFLIGVFIIAIGLRNAGLVDFLVRIYEDSGLTVIATVSAVGSAMLNNHPMALINLLSLGHVSEVGHDAFLAALIGGDLGPRLLPIGSLAGLLWLASLARLNVEISVRRFLTVGLAVTVPGLAISLALLSLF